MKRNNKPVSTWQGLGAAAGAASRKQQEMLNEKIQLSDLSKIVPDTTGGILMDANLEEALQLQQDPRASGTFNY